MKFKNLFKKIGKIPKGYFMVGIVLIIAILTVAIPSLARYKNRATISTNTVWKGEVATSYHGGSGSKDDPYIISTGAELAYFSNMLKTTNYNNTYFILGNDIFLNDGVFQYENNAITYQKKDKTLYLKEYTNELYEDKSMTVKSNETVNIFPSLVNFRGNFDGNSSTIYGLLITDSGAEELGLFTNLTGNVYDLLVRNSLVYGGKITGGIASSSNANKIKNVLYEGAVVGKSDESEKTITLDIPNQEQTNLESNKETEVDLSKLNTNVLGSITSTTLTGVCQSDISTGKIKINDKEVSECNNNSFSIDLGNVEKNKLVIKIDEGSNATNYKLTDLKYVLKYKEGLTAGVVAKANDLNIENSINKGNVVGSSLAGGIVAKGANLNIKNSYNTAEIKGSNVAAGLVGEISYSNADGEVSKCYNTGAVTGLETASLIGTINNNSNQISIKDSFQTTEDYVINKINNSTVNINNSYTVGSNKIRDGVSNGEFTTANIATIKNNISFNKYISQKNYETNSNNIWVLNRTNLPVLFLDNVLDSKATITVGKYTWDSQANDLETYFYKDNLTFTIQEKSTLNPLKEVYYYISNKELTNEEIVNIGDWKLYENITTVDKEGSYVIYVKAIDYNDNVDYINTDILVLDTTKPSAEISYENYKWNSSTSNLANIYVDSNINIKVQATDELSQVASVRYYLADNVLSNSELDNLEDKNWLEYKDLINIKDRKMTIVYVKVVDNANNTTYINSDYLVYGGYEQTNVYLADQDLTAENNISISNKSAISFTYSFKNDNRYQEGYSRNLIVNKLLPAKTKITILDITNNKAYVYKIPNSEDKYGYNDSCQGKDETICSKKATYPFVLFDEVGTTDIKYIDSEATEINDQYKVILDFSSTDIKEKVEYITVKIQILNEKKNVLYTTLSDTLHKFSIVPTPEAGLSISSTYKGDIIYNSDAVFDIPVVSKLNIMDGVLDNSLRNQIMGIAIRVIDSNKNTVERKYLKNLEFIIGDKNYYPSNDGVVRINLENSIHDFNSVIRIITKKDDLKLNNDTYNLEIFSYLAADGLYSKKTSSEKVIIPIVYEKEFDNSRYGFKITANQKNKILSKNKDAVIDFNIQKSGIENPRVYVSLYKKSIQSAYSQNYDLINLGDYSNNSLETVSYNKYLVKNSSFNNELLVSKLKPGGYKFVFELYDGENKVGEVPYKFIIK